MCGTTDLCLFVDKLKKGKKTMCQCTEVSTPARLEALFKSFQSSFVPSKIRRPSFLASDCVLNPFRCFVKRSAVLFFVSSSRFM